MTSVTQDSWVTSLSTNKSYSMSSKTLASSIRQKAEWKFAFPAPLSRTRQGTILIPRRSFPWLWKTKAMALTSKIRAKFSNLLHRSARALQTITKTKKVARELDYTPVRWFERSLVGTSAVSRSMNSTALSLNSESSWKKSHRVTISALWQQII